MTTLSSLDMDFEKIAASVKKSFCNLITVKTRNNLLEIITAFSTLNNKFVSVFITYTNRKIVVTDNGWISKNYYDTIYNEDSDDIINRVNLTYKTVFNIKVTTDADGNDFFYKTCANENEIPSAVFDLANFIVGAVNATSIQYMDEKEQKEREKFRGEANRFLRVQYNDRVDFRKGLEDMKSVKFNAIINNRKNVFLVNYITGSSPQYFENDLRKSICNFELSAKSKYKSTIKERIALINDKSDGYNPNKSANYLSLLTEKLTRAPIKWTEKESLLEIIK